MHGPMHKQALWCGCACMTLLLAGALAGCGSSPNTVDPAPSESAVSLQEDSSSETSADISALWNQFASSLPAESALDESPAYQELLSHGDATLSWAFNRFRSDAPAEPEGEALWHLMADLLGDEVGLQAETDTTDPVTSCEFATGYEAFNAWFVQAGRLLDEKGLDYLAVHAPKTHALLTTG